MNEAFFAQVLLAAMLWVAVALVCALSARWRAARVVGPKLACTSGAHRRWRIVLVVLHTVALAVLVASVQGEVKSAGAALLATSLVLVIVAPALDARWLGEGGVQDGWSAWPLSALEEWRLTGEHLRFRTRGEWSAVSCPVALQVEVRARLEREAPDRESRFQR